MSDSLISPAVGAGLWIAAMGVTALAARRARAGLDDRAPATMGVLGAFVFAAQMINFTIPYTGSSGHLAGGLLLAILLGPHGAFLTIASVLTLQALFFYDGGLLALGCNMMNIGFLSCYVAYPLVYRPLAGVRPSRARAARAAVIGSVVALQLGALAVVVETVASGVSALPFARFAMLMLPIHLAIGVVEGIVTAAAVALIRAARPEWAMARGTVGPTRRMLAAIGVATLLVAGVLSWFASSRPDGLEWSTARVTGGEQIQSRASGVGTALERIQTMTSRMPDYAFKSAGESPDAGPDGTSSAGLIGSILTLGLVALVGAGLRRRGARDAKA